MEMSKTTFTLVGGAGNQLFGIYAGLHFQAAIGRQAIFTYKPSGEYSYTSSILETLKFDPALKISPFLANDLSIFWKTNNRLRSTMKPYNRIWNRFSSNYISPELSIDLKILKTKNIKNIFGYFQTTFYYESMEKLGYGHPKLINPSKWYKNYLIKIKEVSPIIMHVRRGDYLKHSTIYQYLDSDYYAKAIYSLPKDLRDNPIWIFSDDQQQAKDLIKDLPTRNYFVIDQYNQKAIEVLFLMSNGVSHITANSTFSWWSAMLSTCSTHVVAPKVWFKDRPTPPDLLPKKWETILCQ